MPGAKGGKKKGGPAGRAALDADELNLLRAGMPARDSIKGVREIVRGGKVYRVIETDETNKPRKPARGRGRKGRES